MSDFYEHVRFDPKKNYDRMLFRVGRGLQSAELNDLQEQVHHHTKGVADAVLKEGDIVHGGDIAVNKVANDTHKKHVRLGPSRIYLEGQVRDVPAKDLDIDANQASTMIGVLLTKRLVDEVEDISLLDPAQHGGLFSNNGGEPGATRLQVNCRWTLQPNPDDLGQHETYYPIHRFENGVLVQKNPPPQLDAVTTALARYDRESNGGHYVIDGLRVQCYGYPKEGEAPDGSSFNMQRKQVFNISEGKAHIDGYELAFPTSVRKAYPADFDRQTISDESHQFNPTAGSNKGIIEVKRPPLDSIEEITILQLNEDKEMLRGSGITDDISEANVEKILSIRVGSNVISKNDYVLERNKVKWKKSPPIGTGYTITYHARRKINPPKVKENERSFEVQNAIPGSDVVVSYQTRVPRIDAIVLDRQDEMQTVHLVKGISDLYNPRAPSIGDNQLLLAYVHHDWYLKKFPKIQNVATRVVTMPALEEMQSQIKKLFELVSIERLKNNFAPEEPTSKHGIFVDPFFDNDMRDLGTLHQGEVQDAQVIDGQLMLPIKPVVPIDLHTSSGNQPILLNESADNDAHAAEVFVEEVLIAQPKRTGSMLVNPYQAFDPIPATVTLTPAVDHWTVTNTEWANPVTRRMRLDRGIRSNTTVETLSTTVTELEYLRSREVAFEIDGFDGGESLERIEMNGVVVYHSEGGISA